MADAFYNPAAASTKTIRRNSKYLEITLPSVGSRASGNPQIHAEWAIKGNLRGGQIGVFMNGQSQGLAYIGELTPGGDQSITFDTGMASVTGGPGGINDAVNGRNRKALVIYDTTAYDARDGGDMVFRLVPRDNNEYDITGWELKVDE